MALSEQQRAVLDLERTWWQESGTKSEAIRARLGLSRSRFNQLLSELVTDKDAEAYDPLVVARLRRAKRERRRQAVGPRHAAALVELAGQPDRRLFNLDAPRSAPQAGWRPPR
jgi:hypothetical protein